ncbi:MAG: LD-carboxypeptidase [Candidatus Limisoma sp.]
MIYPKPLNPGDVVAIVSPASKIKPEYVEGACATLRRWGYEPRVAEHCLGEHGSFSGTRDERLGDLRSALTDPSVRAVLCSRGGYGVVHLLEGLSDADFVDDPKWIIGFSDISLLHAAAHRAGVASIHSSMARHLTERPDDDCSASLRAILAGEFPSYSEPGRADNRLGVAEGTIVGGNLAVLAAIIDSKWDLFTRDNILFIEDIAEPIYNVERQLYNLRLNGTLAHTRGIVFGQFTDYKPDRDHQTMEEMLARFVSDLDIPVALHFPVGHVDRNLPIVEGAQATLEVGEQRVNLTLSK